MGRQSLATVLAAALLSAAMFSVTAHAAQQTSQPIVVGQDDSGGATSGGATSDGATSDGATSPAPAPAPDATAQAPSDTQQLPPGPAATSAQAGILGNPIWIVGGALV